VTPEGVGDSTNTISIESPEKVLVSHYNTEGRFSMNLKSILKSLLFVVFVIVSINAQDAVQKAQTDLDSAIESSEGKTEMFISIVVIDGKSMVAKNRHEYQVLSSMVDMVNVLKRVKAKKGIDATQYTNKVSALFEHAEALGIRVN
jgi:hypothetical protein